MCIVHCWLRPIEVDDDGSELAIRVDVFEPPVIDDYNLIVSPSIYVLEVCRCGA